MKQRLLFFLLLLTNLCLYSQKTLQIDSINTTYSFNNKHIVLKRTVPFTEVKKISNFKGSKIYKPKIGEAYWQKFFINIKNKNVSYIEFNLNFADKVTLFVPLLSNEYKKVETGLSVTKTVTNFSSLQQLIIPYKNIDFSKPFYTKNVPMSFSGLESVLPNGSTIYLIAHSHKPLYLDKNNFNKKLKTNNFNYVFTLLIGMIIISFVYIFAYYLITKKLYFLYYALYLFFLIFNYGYRTFYFYNFYSKINEHLYFYINENGQLLANFCYILFLKYFINIKKNYPKILKTYNIFIASFASFIILHNIVIITNPYFPYHRFFIKTSIYFFSIFSYGTIFYMMYKKQLFHTTIIFIGSCLLLTGYILATILNEFFILVPIIVIETVLFMSVITYLDVKNFKKSLERDHLFEINKMKNKLVTNVSHEFRTPLTLISGPIHQVLKSNNLTSNQRNYLELIERNSNRLSVLVNQLLDVLKIENSSLQLKIGQYNLQLFFENIYEGFEFLARKKEIKFFKYNTLKKNEHWFDKDVFEKIISNLLSNAIKYTPKNGSIICQLKIEKGICCFTIKNSGKGLTKQEQQKIFEQFYQVNENTDGVGIGLALVKELVFLHKGKISVNSTPNEWTIFTVEIPVHRKHYDLEEITKEPLTLTTTTVFNNEEIEEVLNNNASLPILLIVDDNEDIVTYIESIFKTSYFIVKATNGEEGVTKALRYVPDIIVSDVMMPKKNGVELCNELKTDERTSHIPIILLTAKAGEENELTGIKSGADAYITKPFNEEFLRVRIEKLIEVRTKIQQRYKTNFKIPTTEFTENSFSKKVEKILEEELTNPDFSVENFSKLIGMSRMQLHRKLKALTGTSTSEFIKTQRLKMAGELLLNSQASISEIGYKVGFNNHAYFSKVFKEFYNCTPSEYRNNTK